MWNKFHIQWDVTNLQNANKDSSQNIDKSMNFNNTNITLNEIKDEIKKSNKILAWFAWILSWIIWWTISGLIVFYVTKNI